MIRISGKISWFFCLTALLAAESRADDQVSFNRDIRPIFSEKCLACHGPDEKKREADLRLDVEASAVAAIKPGSPESSELVKRITSDDPDLRMPPADSGRELTAGEIELFKRWIKQGAKFESHWSFIPPRRPKAPAVKDDSKIRAALDRFVQRRLESEDLTMSPEASRAELIRRVSLDLIGLPPTPAEVEAFENDTSQDAWKSVVDRLLQSDRFGEHMARYWLDAARYADTNGYQYDLEREQWVWRDWVIHAFNSNMPFDQFTIEQLAGDLLPNATDQQKLATAFHRNHPITIEGGVIDEEYRTEYVVDRVVTTSSVWLGLTMTCGRCHDHKYDPISQREFYQFFAFFNQVPERGLNGFNPKIKVSSPLQTREMSQAGQRLAAAEQRFKKLAATIEQDLAAWARQVGEDVKDQWTIVLPATQKSAGGAELVVQSDQSILATGKNPPVETYELVLASERPIHAIRLEALKDKSLVSSSTGRAFNGNFVLSEFQVAASSATAPDEFKPVKIASAEADYSQRNYHISLAIDGKLDKTGWAIDGNTKFENRVAVFKLAQPLLPDVTGKVRVQLQHRFGGSHSIGRFRLALASRPIKQVPAEIAAIARKSNDARNPAERVRLNEYLVEQFGSKDQRMAVAELKQARQRQADLQQTPATMVMAEIPKPRTTHVLFRGEYDKPRDAVESGTPSALPPMNKALPRNRLGLARWLVSPENPLTARVTVNRYWQHMFGTGIVETAEDFGSQGEWPSHPELLDWLAVEFVESGWNVKGLLKQIVMSAAYRQSSHVKPELLARDPHNRLLSRGPRFRLDAEVIRDSALLVSGLMTERLGGPSVFPYHPTGLWQEINNRPGYSRVYKQDAGDKLYRRSLYTFWKRTVPPPSMATFDAPQREYCVVRRSRTNTPLQAIVMLHDPQFVEAARHLGQRMMTEGGATVEQQIEYGFRLCTARRPSDQEAEVLKKIFEQRHLQYQKDSKAAARLLAVGESNVDPSLDQAELAAWTTLGRVLLNLSEFVTKG